MNKISRVIKFLYIFKLTKFLLFTPTHIQLATVKEIKKQEKLLYFIIFAKTFKILLMTIITIALINILLINNL